MLGDQSLGLTYLQDRSERYIIHRISIFEDRSIEAKNSLKNLRYRHDAPYQGCSCNRKHPNPPSMQSVPPPMLLAPSRRQRGQVESSNSIVDRHQGGDGVNNGRDPEDDGALEQMYVRTIAPDVRLNNQENQAKRVPD